MEDRFEFWNNYSTHTLELGLGTGRPGTGLDCTIRNSSSSSIFYRIRVSGFRVWVLILDITIELSKTNCAVCTNVLVNL